jgi:integrase
VWQAYIDANGHKWGERHLAAHVSLAHRGGEKFKRGKGVTKPGPLAALMPLKLSELTSETVEAWLKQESKKRPTSTAGAYRLLRAFCTWTHGKPAKDKSDYRGIVAPDACSAREVSDALPTTKPKGDKLKRGDLAAWFAAVRAMKNPVISAYLQCLLLTGARREEMAGLRWKDVVTRARPEDSSLTLRDKVEGVREISLPPYVAALINALPRRNEWVFSSETSESGRIIEPRKLHNAALSAAGIDHVSLHGLRRTFATLPDYLDDMPAGVIAQIMGHKPSATAEKHYKVRQIDQLHIWHAKLERWILAEAGITLPVLTDLDAANDSTHSVAA